MVPVAKLKCHEPDSTDLDITEIRWIVNRLQNGRHISKQLGIKWTYLLRTAFIATLKFLLARVSSKQLKIIPTS